MEHLALGLVWLLGMLASVSPMDKQVRFIKMDMALNSFDDQYQGCSHVMEAKLKELNRTEFETKSNYSIAWKKAAAEWQKLRRQSSVLQPEEAIALMAYTLDSPAMYREFNAAVRNASHSREEYLHNFHFKVLHFLLTQAAHALWHAQPCCCHDVYRGVKDIIFTAQPGQTVRFGQFTSTSLKKNIAETFGRGIIFSVKTCHGVSIKYFSFFPNEEEVLIPPFETFEVTSVSYRGNRARIGLRSQAVYSKYNCKYVTGQSVTQDPHWGFIQAAEGQENTVGI